MFFFDTKNTQNNNKTKHRRWKEKGKLSLLDGSDSESMKLQESQNNITNNNNNKTQRIKKETWLSKLGTSFMFMNPASVRMLTKAYKLENTKNQYASCFKFHEKKITPQIEESYILLNSSEVLKEFAEKTGRNVNDIVATLMGNQIQKIKNQNNKNQNQNQNQNDNIDIDDIAGDIDIEMEIANFDNHNNIYNNEKNNIENMDIENELIDILEIKSDKNDNTFKIQQKQQKKLKNINNEGNNEDKNNDNDNDKDDEDDEDQDEDDE